MNRQSLSAGTHKPRFPRALRPTQFAVIGSLCGVAQLGLLAAFTERTNLGTMSNAIAFLISAQLNFVLNRAVTWRDRMHHRPMALFVQVLEFNALTLVAVAFNQAIYLGALRVAPYLIAGAVGIGATTLAKYFIADRWIFRSTGWDSSLPAPAANPRGRSR